MNRPGPRRGPATAGVVALLALSLLAAGPAAASHGEPLDPNATGPGRYLVDWEVRESVHASKGHLKEGQAREWRFTVDEPNVTYVTVNVAWENGDALGSSTFELAVNDPAGSPAPASPKRGSDGRVTVKSGTVAPVPDPFEVDADGRDEVKAGLDEYASDAGAGVWDIRIAHEGGGPDLGDGRDYEVTVTLHYYEAAVFRVVNVDPPTGLDRVTEAAGAPTYWLWSAGGLSVAVLALGVVLLRQRGNRRSGETTRR